MITVGIDEVGRGCWAGPLVAAAVALKEPLAGLRDSKKLTAKRRQELALLIREQALAVGIGWVWPADVDHLGLTEAVRQAMTEALAAIGVEYDEIIIDGNLNYFRTNPKARAIIRADDSVPEVSAASIVAKVARDNYMAELQSEYPHHRFEKHVGYGTALHLEMLKLHGVTPEHRRSFKPIQALIQ